MAIFGSYIGKTHSLPKEAANICVLDTAVALLAGLIIIPSCFAFGVKPGAGPGLIFATLPNVFAQMPAGRICGAAFFLFLSFAALSTLVAVFENIIAYWIDAHGVERTKAVRWNFVAIVLLSLPCAQHWGFLMSLFDLTMMTEHYMASLPKEDYLEVQVTLLRELMSLSQASISSVPILQKQMNSDISR